MTSSSKVTNVVTNADTATAEEVDVFLNVILNSSINLDDVVIIVFEVNSFAESGALFIDELKERVISKQITHPLVKNIIVVDLSLILGRDIYFHLDDHINSSGHGEIAETLSKLILGMPNHRLRVPSEVRGDATER